MRVNIDLDKLKVFYYVAKAKKFTTAAELLHISQSALSRSIQQLEDRLGIKLFYRHPRGLTLTSQGEIMAPIIGKFLDDIESATEKLYEEEKEPKGPFRVVASHGLINYFLLPYIPKFLELYPDIRLTFIASDAIASLEFGEAHIMIRPYIHGSEGEGLIQKHLITNHVEFYASKEYLEKFGVPQTPEDFDHHRLIAFGDHAEAAYFNVMNSHLSLGAKPGCIREPFLQVNVPHARLYLAQAGVGICAISREHPGLKDLNLVQVLPHVKTPSVGSYYIYPKELEKSKKVIAFRDYLVGEFTKTYGEKSQDL